MKRLLPFVLRSLALAPLALFAAGCHFHHFGDSDEHHDHGCGRDCDDAVTRSYDEVDFDQIEVHSAFHLTIRQSDTFSVRITVPEGSTDNIQVQRSGSRLRLSMEHGFLDGDVSAIVQMPRLRQLAAHDASEVQLERIQSPEKVALALEDASQVRGELDAAETDLNLGSTSQARLDGRTDVLKLHATVLSEAHLQNLPCRSADVTLRTGSSATIDVHDSLDVTASDLSVLHYYGDPHIGRKDLSSGGHIEHEH